MTWLRDGKRKGGSQGFLGVCGARKPEPEFTRRDRSYGESAVVQRRLHRDLKREPRGWKTKKADPVDLIARDDNRGDWAPIVTLFDYLPPTSSISSVSA